MLRRFSTALAIGSLFSAGRAVIATTSPPLAGVLGVPISLPVTRHAGGYLTTPYAALDRPHPAVVRIVVPEGEMTSYGSGTLIDVRDQYGLVVTNWHVVRDSRGEVEVVFPDGFTSKARPLKVDADWDLAALIIWRPPVQPVKIASAAPQSGDSLTICGYGSGQYRSATGRCTQYYAPTLDLPQQMVELDVEARQGDSGGPIFNDRGELAGVLFGAGQGTTMGSFGGRVESFLASLAPDIGQGAIAHDRAPQMHVVQPPPPPTAPVQRQASAQLESPASVRTGMVPQAASGGGGRDSDATSDPAPQLVAAAEGTTDPSHGWHAASVEFATPHQSQVAVPAPPSVAAADWFAAARNALAAVGAIAIFLQLARLVR